MSTIITRSGKGSALTFNEVDANFTNLNTDKLQSGNTAAALTITSATINGGSVLTSTLTDPIRHSVRPSLLLDFANTKQLDPRITFTRASTATFYDGKTTAKAEENLIVYSQELDNAGLWGASNTIVTANSTTAPDGTTTAETITENTATGFHTLFQTPVSNLLANTAYTFSLFVKDIDRRYITLSVSGSNGTYFAATYDLTSVVVTSNNASGTGYSHTSSSITSVGSGWYRLVVSGVVGTTVSSQALTISFATNGTPTLDGRGRESYLGTSKAVYAWGAQIEARSAVTAYTPTTTAAITNYIPALQTAASGVPRFDHNPTTSESLGLLIEEQRVNLSLYSEQFDNASWTKNNATVTANTIIAPDGTITGDKVVPSTTSSGNHSVSFLGPTLTAASYTYSVFAKASGYNFLVLKADLSGYVEFNLSTGAITLSGSNYTATITSVGNGWYRCSITFTATVAAYTFFNYSYASTGAPIYSGDGFSGLYIWGAQLEAGAFATSYIPTVASQVTRPADAASLTGTNFSSWYRQDEGTAYVDVSLNTTSITDAYPLRISGGNAIVFGYKDSGTTVRPIVTSVAGNGLSSIPASYKAVGAYSFMINEKRGAVNGTLVSSTLTGSIGLNTSAEIGGFNASAGKLNGAIKKIAYYPKSLTNAELQGLTTI